MASVALQYGVSQAALRQANPLAGQYGLIPGQRLCIPGNSVSPSPGNSSCPSGRFHQVFGNDTLSSIALRYGITQNALQQANPLLGITGLFVGMLLCIPLQQTLPAPVIPITPVVPPVTPVIPITPVVPVLPPCPGNAQRVVVSQGQTVGGILSTYNVTYITPTQTSTSLEQGRRCAYRPAAHGVPAAFVQAPT